MTGASQVAYSIGLVMMSYASAFAQFVSDPVEKILTDASIPNTEKSNRLSALGEEGVPALLGYLQDNAGAWIFIVPALGEIGDSRATAHLLERLNAEPNELRIVIQALGKLKDPDAVDPLLNLIDSEGRAAAIPALAAIGDARAEAPVLALMRSTDESVVIRIQCAHALLALASEENRLEASDLLLEDKYLHEAHEKQRPLTHPYWRFPHETWWSALRDVGTDAAYEVLARWFEVPLMDYDHGALIEIMGGISNPSIQLIESLYGYSSKNFPGGSYYSALALEALTGYGPIVDRDRLLGEIRRWLLRVESQSEFSPSTPKLIQRLTRIESEVESWE